MIVEAAYVIGFALAAVLLTATGWLLLRMWRRVWARRPGSRRHRPSHPADIAAPHL